MAFNVFATATTSIPLANLDANFTLLGSAAAASTLYPTATTSITYGTTGTTHYFSGLVNGSASGAFGGSTSPASGTRVSIGHDGTLGTIYSYDYTGSAWKTLYLSGSAIQFAIGGTGTIGTVSSTGLAVTGTLSATGTLTNVVSPTGTTVYQTTSALTTGAAVSQISNNAGTYYYGVQNSAGNVFTGITGYDLLLQSPSGTGITLGTGAVPAVLRISATGQAVTGLLDISAATSGQIKFPATQNASTDANTLDDYEEGTWVPNQGSGLTVVGTFSSTGNYVKVGKMVTVQVSLTATTTIAISATDSVIFTNLPFASSPTRNPGIAVNIAHSAGLFVNAASTTVYSCGTLVASATIYVSITYQTS